MDQTLSGRFSAMGINLEPNRTQLGASTPVRICHMHGIRPQIDGGGLTGVFTNM